MCELSHVPESHRRCYVIPCPILAVGEPFLRGSESFTICLDPTLRFTNDIRWTLRQVPLHLSNILSSPSYTTWINDSAKERRAYPDSPR